MPEEYKPLNTHSLWRLEFAREISQKLRQFEGIEAMIVGGSVARGYADQYSDLEIPLFWAAPPSDAVRFKIIEVLQAELLYPYNGPEMEDNLLIHGFQVDLWHQTVSFEETVFDDVLLRYDTDLGSSNFMDTIRACIPLYGDALIHRWKQRAQEYPDRLVEKNLREHIVTLNPKHLALHAYRQNPTLVHQGIAELQQRIFQILLALNRQYFPTYKWMYATLQALTTKPAQIEERFRLVFTMSLSDAVAEMLRLLNETLALIAAHYPHIDTTAVMRNTVLARTAYDQPVHLGINESEKSN